MACNPRWPEIKREVENYIPGQPTVDRPNTIARVFKMKLNDLMDDIRKGNHFGRVKPESCWHLLGYEMHYRFVVVERPPFHEEGCNRVYFRDDDQLDNVIERETSTISKFTEWMKANEIVSDRDKVFRDVYQYISEDVVRKHPRLLHNQNVVFIDQEVQNYTLLELEAILNCNNKSLLDFSELPQIDYTLMNISENRLIAAERMYNANEEWSRFTSLYGGLIPQQRDVYDNIMQAVNE
ncbi:replication factor A protein 1 [Tanacetum coccineum]